MSGYQDCGCRDCFEIAIGDGEPVLCNACEDAGCDLDGGECCCEPEHEEDHFLNEPFELVRPRGDREDFHSDG